MMSQPKEFVWEQRIKRIVHYWYIYKGYPLQAKEKGEDGLIELMKARHKFSASKAQYGKLFRDCGWTKNRTKTDRENIALAVQRRKIKRLESDVYDNGRLLPYKKLRKDLSRHSVPISEVFDSKKEEFIPMGIQIRPASDPPLNRLVFDNLPILEFQSNLLQLQGPTNLNNQLATQSRDLIFSHFRKNSNERVQPFIDALLPTSEFLDEPDASQLTIHFNKGLSNNQVLNLEAFLLSNNLPGEANGESVYRWIKKQGSASVIEKIALITSPTAKSLLETVFRLAMEAGDAPVVKHLLRANIDPNGHQCYVKQNPMFPNAWGSLSPLQLACIRGDTNIALALLKSGAKLQEDEVGVKSSMIILAIIGGYEGMLGFSTDWHTVMIRVIDHGIVDRLEAWEVIEEELLCLVQELIVRGAKINPSPNIYAQSPLSAAQKYKSTEIEGLLIACGASIFENPILEDCLCTWKRNCVHRSPKLCPNLSPFEDQYKPSRCHVCLNMQWKHFVHRSGNYPAFFRLNNGRSVPAGKKRLGRLFLYNTCPNCAGLSLLDLAVMLESPFLVEEISQRFSATEFSLEYLLKYSGAIFFRRDIYQFLLAAGNLQVTKVSMMLMMRDFESFQNWVEALSRKTPDMQAKILGVLGVPEHDLMNIVLNLFHPNCPPIGSLVPSEHVRLGLFQTSSTTYMNLALRMAVICKRYDYVESLLENGAKINYTCGYRHWTALAEAVRMDDLKCVQILLKHGAGVNREYDCGEKTKLGSLLALAMKVAKDPVVEILIKAGADLNSIRADSFHYHFSLHTPLGEAVENNRSIWIDYLLEAGVDVNSHIDGNCGCPDGSCALYIAISSRNVASVRELLAHGADIQVPHFWPATTDDKILELLLDNCDEEWQREIVAGSATEMLLEAIKNRNLPSAVLIIRRGLVEVNALRGSDHPLSIALEWDNSPGQEMVQLLLSSGANVNLPVGIFGEVLSDGLHEDFLSDDVISAGEGDAEERSLHWRANPWSPILPVQVAAILGNSKALKLLLQAGAKPDMVEQGLSLTALQLAVLFRGDQMIRQLLEFKADPDKCSACEYSEIDIALSWAKKNYSANWCNIDVTLVAKHCKDTPLQIATQSGCKDIIEALIEYGADVNAPAAERAGATALQYAAMHGYIGIALLLLENGADVNARPALIDGRTALEGAAEYGRIDMVQMLCNAKAEITDRVLELASNNGHHALRELLENRRFYEDLQICFDMEKWESQK